MLDRMTEMRSGRGLDGNRTAATARTCKPRRPGGRRGARGGAGPRGPGSAVTCQYRHRHRYRYRYRCRYRCRYRYRGRRTPVSCLEVERRGGGKWNWKDMHVKTKAKERAGDAPRGAARRARDPSTSDPTRVTRARQNDAARALSGGRSHGRSALGIPRATAESEKRTVSCSAHSTRACSAVRTGADVPSFSAFSRCRPSSVPRCTELYTVHVRVGGWAREPSPQRKTRHPSCDRLLP